MREGDEYVYKNLHNEGFNHWRHPFEGEGRATKEERVELGREEIKKLVKFKQYVEGKKKGRVPAIIDQCIRQDRQK